jgi:hypothetical protein
VGSLGVLAGQFGQSRHGVPMDPGQSRGLADSQPFAEMFQDLQDFGVGKLGVEQRRSLELGEAGATNVAVEESMIVFAIHPTDREIAGVTLTMTFTIGILAAEGGETVSAVHDKVKSWS